MDLLVAAAHPPELEGLSERLSSDQSAEVCGLEVGVAAVGIGLCDAAVGAAWKVHRASPRAVLLLGTCGAYAGSGLTLGQVVVAAGLQLICPSVAEGRAGLPGPMATTASCDACLQAGLIEFGARPVQVATTLAITTDDELADRVRSAFACDVEHLEAFAVARTCAARGIPFAALFGVSNRVGVSARGEWLAHHLSAGRAAAVLARAWLDGGAPGLPGRSPPQGLKT